MIKEPKGRQHHTAKARDLISSGNDRPRSHLWATDFDSERIRT
jgi:hypothetical protein